MKYVSKTHQLSVLRLARFEFQLFGARGPAASAKVALAVETSLQYLTDIICTNCGYLQVVKFII